MTSPTRHLPDNFPMHLACPACGRDCNIQSNVVTGVVLHVCLRCGEVLAFLSVGDHPSLVRPTPAQVQILREDVRRYRAALRVSESVKQFRLWAPCDKDRRQ